jgi:hypothetical protein
MTEDITSISPRNDGRSNDGIRAIDDGGGGAWLGIFGGAAVEWYLNLAGLA